MYKYQLYWNDMPMEKIPKKYDNMHHIQIK